MGIPSWPRIVAALGCVVHQQFHFRVFWYIPNVSVRIQVKDAKGNYIQRRCSSLSEKDIIYRPGVLCAERRNNKSRFGERVREGGKDRAI